VIRHLQDDGNDRGNGDRKPGGGDDNEYARKPHRMQLMTWVAGFFASGDDGGPWIEYPDTYEYNAAGVTVGADVDLLPGLVLGFEGGVSDTDIDWDTTDSDGGIGSSHGGAYGKVAIGNGFIEMAFDHAVNEYDNRRHIDLGPASRYAESEYDGNQSSSYVGAGYHFEWGGFKISPIVSVQHTHLSEDGYAEQGAGALNLTVDDRSEDSLQSVAGLHITHRGHVGWVGIESRLRTRWTHEFETDGRELDATFSEAGGASFSTTGPPGDDDRLQLGGGITARFIATAAFLNVDLIFDGSHVVSQSFNLGTRTRF
jgi:outer membrane autotransporter protein